MAIIEELRVPRAPIQISSCTHPGTTVYTVLCNDGTIWTSHGGIDWTLLSPIPQPKKIDITVDGGSQ